MPYSGLGNNSKRNAPGTSGSSGAGLLAKGYDIPVIDPVPFAVRMAAALIESGVSHSKITYEKPSITPLPVTKCRR